MAAGQGLEFLYLKTKAGFRLVMGVKGGEVCVCAGVLGCHDSYSRQDGGRGRSRKSRPRGAEQCRPSRGFPCVCELVLSG